MAKNDAILIDGILDDRVIKQFPSERRDEVFEYFAFEHILRDFDLSQEEIIAGTIDGRDDGGIDGFYVFVNGHLLSDPESFYWPRCGCELDVWIITCKHHETFRQAPLDNLVASLNELLDLSISDKNLKGAYSESLINSRRCLILAYRKVSSYLNRFSLRLVYASRGDSSSIGDSIIARSKQAVSKAKELFGNCEASFSFIGATELVSIHRKVRTFSLELPFIKLLSHGERYVLLCRLSDFYSFVVDENKKLRRYLFDSNVRAFMGLNRVNEDIRNTLNNPDSPDFWWLNNGVTILANKAVVMGESIKLENVQIVNGLQTTESISRFFCDGNDDPKQRAVLVKIIVSSDSSIRDAIIRATNNQTEVGLASLHATDKIQRDIEEVLFRDGLFYERRAKFYANQGQPAALIATPLYVASGVVSLILKSPASATKIRGRFMRSDIAYNRVFSQTVPIKVWPIITRILKKTDTVLETLRPVGTVANENFLKKWRQLTAFIATSRVFGKFSFTASELSDFIIENLTNQIIQSSWEFIKSQAGSDHKLKAYRGKNFVTKVCQKAAQLYSITCVNIVERYDLYGITHDDKLFLQFVEQVDKILPPQPWRPGVHYEIAKKLACDAKSVSDAIQHLIATERRNPQRDGIVYDSDGKIIVIDESRAVISLTKEEVGDDSINELNNLDELDV